MIMKKYIAIFLGVFFTSNSYADNKILGKWKVVDDRSGVVASIVQIYKNTDETYSGKILKIYPQLDGSLPPYNETCTKCKGELKDNPILGMKVLFGFKQNPKNKVEYVNGRIIDPQSGGVYKGKMKIAKNYRRLSLVGYIENPELGRKQIWIRVE